MTKTGERRVENNMTGFKLAISVGGVSTERGDRSLLDDPHNVIKAESDAPMSKKSFTPEQRERRRAYLKAWRAEHREHCRAYDKRQRQKRREQRRADNARWYETHRQEVLARRKRYYEENRERINRGRKKRRRAQKEAKRGTE